MKVTFGSHAFLPKTFSSGAWRGAGDGTIPIIRSASVVYVNRSVNSLDVLIRINLSDGDTLVARADTRVQ
jgi:hypothetical protein